jgi:hypothetical protein
MGAALAEMVAGLTLREKFALVCDAMRSFSERARAREIFSSWPV